MKDPAKLAKWEILYKKMVSMAVDDLITKEEILALVGMNYASPLRKASDEMLVQHRRAIVSERGVGYRLAKANEHSTLAERYHRKASSSAQRGINVVTFVRRDELTDRELKHNEFMEIMMSRIGKALVVTGRKLDEHEDRLSNLEAQLGIASPLPMQIEAV